MSTDFLAAGRLWLLLLVVGLAVLYVVVLRWRSAATVRFTQIDLLDQVAPQAPTLAAPRRRRAPAARSGRRRRRHRPTGRPRDRADQERGPHPRAVRRVAVDDGRGRRPGRFVAAREAARDFVDGSTPASRSGLSFLRRGHRRGRPDPRPGHDAARHRRLELAESTAIGDALAAAPGCSSTPPTRTTTTGARRDGAAERRRDHGRPAHVGGRPGGRRRRHPGVHDRVRHRRRRDRRPRVGDVVPVPVRPADLELVAEATGGESFEARPATNWRAPTTRSRSRSATRSARRSRSSRNSPGSGRSPRSSASAPPGR